MDPEATSERSKKGRIRRKQTINAILKQMHFYFSDANLSKDRFLKQCLNESEYVDINVFLTFNKIRKMTTTTEDIVKAVKKSDLLQLNDDSTKIKRCIPHSPKANENECTIYVQTLQPDVSQDWLIDIFSEFGNVDYVSLPKYSHSKHNKGFAFIEFESVEGVRAALAYFDSVGLRISSQIDAEKICSNVVDEEMSERENEMVKKKIKIEKQEANESVKRKMKTERLDENESVKKKMKIEKHDKNDSTKKEMKTEKQDDTKVTKSTKRKAQIKELALQILPKDEWRKLRNRYWEMQRKKMRQLKQHLNKRVAQQFPKTRNEEEPNIIPKPAKKTENCFQPGVIVKVKLNALCSDPKTLKNEMRNTDANIVYIDVPTTIASDEAFIRLNSSENAKAFCSRVESSTGIASILSGDEEKEYWEKIEQSRAKRMQKDVKKQRGRNKLLKRAERELGKHIRFEDEDD